MKTSIILISIVGLLIGGCYDGENINAKSAPKFTEDSRINWRFHQCVQAGRQVCPPEKGMSLWQVQELCRLDGRKWKGVLSWKTSDEYAQVIEEIDWMDVHVTRIYTFYGGNLEGYVDFNR